MTYYITTKAAVTPFVLLGTSPNRTDARVLAKNLGGSVRTEAEYNELVEKAALDERLADSLKAAYPTGASQVLADEIGSEDPTDQEIAESNAALQNPTEKMVAPIGSDLTHDAHDHLCPHCGCDLNNGIGEHLQEVNGKSVKHDKYLFACLACNGEFGPTIGKPAAPKTTMVKVEHSNKSAADRPCKLVWAIADEMFAVNPSTRRKEVLAECVNRGVAFYTARTQYQQWLSIQKEMAEREAAQAK